MIASYVPIFLPADVISTVEFNQTGDLLATGDKGGRVVIFQRETEVGFYTLDFKTVTLFYTQDIHNALHILCILKGCVSFTFCPGQSKGELEEVGETGDSGEYNVYSTFQSHEPDFDYLKSLEIEEKINKIRWLPQQNAAHFLLSTNGEKPVTTGDQP